MSHGAAQGSGSPKRRKDRFVLTVRRFKGFYVATSRVDYHVQVRGLYDRRTGALNQDRMVDRAKKAASLKYDAPLYELLVMDWRRIGGVT